MTSLQPLDPDLQVELLAGAKKQIFFLRAVHSAGFSLGAPKETEFHRYTLWLDLLEDYEHNDEANLDKNTINQRKENVNTCSFEKKGGKLVPPLDIAWLWHCHRLAPATYSKACKALYPSTDKPFSLEDFQFAESDPKSKNSKFTRHIWESKYPSVPFYNKGNNDINRESAKKEWSALNHIDEGGTRSYGILCGYDIIHACARQSSFLWHISQPQYNDDTFLRQGIVNYGRFLNLMDLFPTEVLIPSLQVKLIWRVDCES